MADLVEIAPDQATIIRPGDTVILRFNRPLTPDEIDNLKVRWDERLPDVNVVFLSGVQDMAVHRKE